MSGTLVAILLYVGAQLAIGVWVSRRISTEADYLVAGRSLGYALCTFSLFATWFGAETCVGSAGAAYSDGISLTSAEPFGYGLCLILLGLVFAAPLWRRGLTTLADLFRQRYSVGVERLAAVVLVPASLLWAAAQVRAFGQVLSSASGMEVESAITAAAAMAILYTIFGGMLADAITDLIQGGALILGIGVVLVAVLLRDGGPPAIDPARIQLAGTGGASLMETLEAWAIPVCGSVVATELVARTIAARSAAVAKRSALLGGALYLLVGLGPVYVGLVGADLVADPGDAEQIFPTVAREMLPAALYALFAGALVSAILSTIDSALLVSASLVSHNLVVPMRGGMGERAKVRLARLFVALFGAIAYVMALRAETVYALVEQSSALGSAGSLVVVVFALFTRFGGPRAAAGTLLVGMASYLWANLGAGLAFPFLTSLAASLVAYVAIGAIERRR